MSTQPQRPKFVPVKEHFRNQFHQTIEIAGQYGFVQKQPEPQLIALDSTNPENTGRSGWSAWYVSVITEQELYLRHSFYRCHNVTDTSKRHVIFVKPVEEHTILAAHTIADTINSAVLSSDTLNNLQTMSMNVIDSSLVEVRMSTAHLPWLPKSAAEILAFDTDHRVREVLANNPHVSDRIRAVAASQQ